MESPPAQVTHCAQSVSGTVRWNMAFSTVGFAPAFIRPSRYSHAMRSEADRLRHRAFHRAELAPPILEILRRALRGEISDTDRGLLESLEAWVLAPLTLWPVQIDDLAQLAVAELESYNRRLKPATRLLIRMLGSEPATATQALEDHERASQKGQYESLFPSQWRKFEVKEKALLINRRLREDWCEIRKTFDVGRYRTNKGILRRSMIPERNFRPGWHLDFKSPKARFQTVFDTFCWRWDLYGMDANDTPLLAKPTATATPLGTLIFIPRYWNFDPSRDIDWKAIRTIHRTLDPRPNKRAMEDSPEIIEEAERAWHLNQQAERKQLKGEARISWVMNQLGWPESTDERKLRRRLRQYAQLAGLRE